jgi:hypothetical protein
VPDDEGRSEGRARHAELRGVLLALPLLVVGVIATVVVLRNRESDTAFLFGQQGNPTERAASRRTQLEAALRRSREPVPGGGGSRARTVSCRRGSAGELGNPWTCSVRYVSGTSYRYTVRVAPAGSFQGVTADRTRVVRGCCVARHGEGTGYKRITFEAIAWRRARRAPTIQRSRLGPRTNRTSSRVSGPRGLSSSARRASACGSRPASPRAIERPKCSRQLSGSNFTALRIAGTASGAEPRTRSQ